MSKVIVTGGAGFIGSHIAKALVAEGHEVHVIDNLAAGVREHVPSEATFHEVDICDFELLSPIFQGATYVFHEAALPRVQFSIEFPRETNESNITGTVNVLKASVDAGVQRVIYAASSSAYGDQAVLPLQEDMIANPLSPYGAQKYMGEVYNRVWSEVYGLETVSLRYFNAYGTTKNPNSAYALVMDKFLELQKAGKPLTITGDGKQTRDFTHIDDIVRANLLAMTSEKVGKGEVINIGAGHNHSVNEIAKLMGGPIEYIPARLEPKNTLADNTRAKELLGWEPQVSLEEGIRRMKEE